MVERCTSCNAPVVWVLTTKGRRMPLDIGLHDDGNLTVENGIASATGERPAYRSHFATYPNAAQHRRRKTRAPRGLEGA